MQLLADRLDLRTVGLRRPSSLGEVARPEFAAEVVAGISWSRALKQQDLIDVEVEFDLAESTSTFAAGSPHGTRASS